MQLLILKVVKSGDMFSVKSEKAEGGSLNKRNLVLQELGGRFENQYVASALGSHAEIELKEGDLVLATLRFQAREYNGQSYQDITVTELMRLEN